MGALCSIHEQIPIQARVKATLAPSPQRLHRSCQSTIVDSHQYPATNLKLKQSIIPLRIQPIPPWSESESHCDKQTSSETEIQPQTAKMAAVPKNLSETGRRDSNNSQKRAQLSHGRGGAGNMGVSTKDTEPINLETPTIKSEMYTTGRGGSGNMARNTDALEARRAQDVVAMPRRESGNNTHVGRGGAANVFKPSAADLETAKKDNAKWESAVGDDRSEDGREGLVPGATAGKGGVKSDGEKSKGLADRGKEWLMGKMGKEGVERAWECDVERGCDFKTYLLRGLAGLWGENWVWKGEIPGVVFSCVSLLFGYSLLCSQSLFCLSVAVHNSFLRPPIWGYYPQAS